MNRSEIDGINWQKSTAGAESTGVWECCVSITRVVWLARAGMAQIRTSIRCMVDLFIFFAQPGNNVVNMVSKSVKLYTPAPGIFKFWQDIL